MGCHFLLEGIFPTQESNPDLPHCRQMLYHLSYRRSPKDVFEHLFLGAGRQEYWSGLPVPSPGDFPNPGIELRSPELQTLENAKIKERKERQKGRREEGVPLLLLEDCICLLRGQRGYIRGCLKVVNKSSKSKTEGWSLGKA